jgi:nucleoside-diphosphate-sugar epimerase
MTVFVTGATGFIGGSVAKLLVENGYIVRGLTRSADKADQLRELSIEPVIGSFSDALLLSREAIAADAVINAADADAVEPIRTLIRALAGTGKSLIHTSGSSIVADEAAGGASDIIHSSLPERPVEGKVARVAIDREVLNASGLGIRATVICPTMVYGEGRGPHKESIQVPLLLRHAKQTGMAQYIGEGLNRWSNIHIEDLSALYLSVLQRPDASGFYFAENGEESLRNIVERLAQLLSLPAAQSIGIDEAIALWGLEPAVYALGSNSRVTATEAKKQLAWSPRHGSLIDDLPREVSLHRLTVL